MVERTVTVLGGLPLIADVWFTRGDGWTTDDDAGVDALYWIKRDGSKGKPVSEAMYDRISKRDQWWEADVTEQVSEQLAYEAWEARESQREERAEPDDGEFDLV